MKHLKRDSDGEMGAVTQRSTEGGERARLQGSWRLAPPGKLSGSGFHCVDEDVVFYVFVCKKFDICNFVAQFKELLYLDPAFHRFQH